MLPVTGWKYLLGLICAAPTENEKDEQLIAIKRQNKNITIMLLICRVISNPWRIQNIAFNANTAVQVSVHFEINIKACVCNQ